MSEQPSESIIFQEGFPGLMGANGKFHPITTDMNVEVSASMDGRTILEPTIPNGIDSRYAEEIVQRLNFQWLNSHVDTPFNTGGYEL